MASVTEMFTAAMQHHQAGDLQQAAHLYRLILQTDPDHADAHHMLGLLAYQTKRFDVAIASIRRALALNPLSVHYHANIGLAYQALGQTEDALAHFQEALRVQPDSAIGHRNLAKALLTQGRAGEAVAHFQEALRIQPNFAEAHNSLGIALLQQGNAEDAAAHCQEAVRLKPGYVEAHNNLGTAHKQLGHFEEALASFEQAIRLRQDYGVARWNRSTLRLLRGDFAQGWPEYEWRWAIHGFAVRQFPQPLWDGAALHGATIVLYAEQGLGDTVHFIRYVPLVCQRGGKVIVECQPPLLQLLAGYPGVDALVGRGSPLPAFDVQAPLLSLPGIFRTTLETIPATVPYLQANAGLVEQWRRELQGRVDSEQWTAKRDRSLSTVHRPLFKIGIAWQGSPEHPGDRQRSIPLKHYARLADAEGVRLISLQKGPGTEQIPDAWPGRSAPAVLDKPFDEAAGPLGVPVWIALPLAPDWRWLLQREDSPWYPTMRLFRQTRFGHWDDVFNRIAEEIKKIATDGTRIKHG
jgi:tetratricopeptide (TPR) repeat protein